MRRLKLLGLALAAVCALFVMVAASASAVPLPEFLPAAAQNWTSETDEANPSFETLAGLKVKCEKATAEGTLEANKPLGLFHINFGNDCLGELSATKALCTGLGDSTMPGHILALGTWHAVVDVNTPELGTAILFLLETVHFSCSALILVEVKGSVLCLVLKPLELNKEHLIHCKQTSGMPEETEYFTGSGETKAKAELLSSTNHGPFEIAGELALAKILFPTAVEIHD